MKPATRYRRARATNPVVKRHAATMAHASVSKPSGATDEANRRSATALAPA